MPFDSLHVWAPPWALVVERQRRLLNDDRLHKAVVCFVLNVPSRTGPDVDSGIGGPGER